MKVVKITIFLVLFGTWALSIMGFSQARCVAKLERRVATLERLAATLERDVAELQDLMVKVDRDITKVDVKAVDAAKNLIDRNSTKENKQ